MSVGPDDKMIRVWSFYDAPQEFRDLSPHGGDEDWLAFIPAAVLLADGDYIPWMESGGSFGCCDVSRHAVPGGQIRIGAHA